MDVGRWIRRGLMAMCMAVAVLGVPVTASASPQGLEWLKFPAQVNGKVPTAIAASHKVVQQPYFNSGYMQWRYIHYGDWVSLQNRNTGLCLDVSSWDIGASVFIADCDGTRSQLWQLRTDMDPGAGYWPLENKWSNYKGVFHVLTLWDYTNPVSEMTLWSYYGGGDQRWTVVGVA